MIAKWNIPLMTGEGLEISLAPNSPLFIVGPNGAGKSALVQYAVTSIGSANVQRISAHRQNWLESGSISITPQDRRQIAEQIAGQERNPVYRWREWDPQARLLSVLFDLTADDNAHARKIRDQVYKNDWVALDKIIGHERPAFDRINGLLKVAGFSVTIENVAGEEIIAKHEDSGASYSMAQMSDGERNAVIIAANVLTVKPNTVLLVDEPERHLHRAVIEPFLSALFAERTDCAFIISTHEVALPTANAEARVLMVRSCQWNGDQYKSWDAKLLEKDADLPEDLKRAILGTRKTVLFVEGELQSLDRRLYSLLFPKVTVVPAGSCNDVIQAVKGLQQTSSIHDVKAFGLIDRDDRSDDEVHQLAADGIYALDTYAVESLYYCSDAIVAVARQQAETFGSCSDEFVQDAKRKALSVLARTDIMENMASLLCVRKVKEQFLSQMPDRNLIKGNPSAVITLSVTSPYDAETNTFKELLNKQELDAIVARYPIRQSPVPNEIAKALSLRHQNDYERNVLARVQGSQDLADKLRQRVGILTAAIESHLKHQM